MKTVWLVCKQGTYFVCNSPIFGDRPSVCGSLECSLKEFREILERDEKSEILLEGISEDAINFIRNGLSGYDVKYIKQDHNKFLKVD